MGRHSFPGSDDSEESFDDAPESDAGGYDDDGYDDDGGRHGFDADAGPRRGGAGGYGADFGGDFGTGFGADFGSNLDAGLDDFSRRYTDDVDYGSGFDAGFDDADRGRGGDDFDDEDDDGYDDGYDDYDAADDDGEVHGGADGYDYGDYADGEFIDPARYLRHYDDEAAGDDAGYPEEDTSTGRRAAVAWEGGHRSTDGRRGVAFGVKAALVTVVVAVLAVIGWRFLGDSLSHRAGVAARHCTEGDLAVPVVVDSALTDQLQAFAEKFNKTAKPVGDRCVTVQVATADSDAVVGGFIGDWPARLGQRPALWIPGSSVSVARLQAAAGAETVSGSRSLVTSPVVLAVRPELKSALQKKTWADLPAMQTDPEALPQLGLLGWGPLRLALPIDGNADAALLAGEAVAAAAAPKDGSAVDGVAAVRKLAAGQPKLADTSLATAMNALLGPESPAAAPVHAVATTEQQLFTRGAGLSDPAGQLAGWLPPGPAAVADYPTVLLSGSWLSSEQMTGASEFTQFIHRPEQLAELAKAGFRADDQPHPSSDVTDFPALSQTLSVGDDDARTTIATAFAGPGGRSAVTIMLDTSMSIDESGKSRLAHVVAALNHQLHGLPGDAVVGLWTFDGVEGHSVISTGPLEDPVGGQSRSAALTGELDGLGATAPGAVSFTTLRLVYNQALANYHDGQTNSILVITTGPHTDRTLDGPGLRDFVRGATDAQRPVAVNVIDFGGDTDRPVWQDVAKLSGGSYQNLPGAAGPELAAALATLLT